MVEIAQFQPISSPESSVAAAIRQDGIAELPGWFDGKAAAQLLQAIKTIRRFDASLFLLEEDWEKSAKSHKHTNPNPGHNNLLESVADRLSFVERNAPFRTMLSRLLGPKHRIYFRKLVCRLPWDMLPVWVQELIRGKPSNTLGAYIKPEYRDISYYYDVDLHQDILEWPRQPAGQKEHRLLFFYVHLGAVGLHDSPLCFLKGSHRFGATPYQHDIHHLNGETWVYRDPLRNRTLSAPLFPLVGAAGHAAVWHSCLLHGSQPMRASVPRLALRYTLARDPDVAHCELDAINETIDGLSYLETNYNPGAIAANADGSYGMRHNDFTRLGRMQGG